MGDRQPDPRRPGADDDQDPHERPQEDHRSRGIRAARRAPIETSPNAENRHYLETKRDRLGHKLHHQDLRFDAERPPRGTRGERPPEPEQEIPQLRTAEAEELEAQEASEPEAPPEPETEHAPGRFEVPAGYKVMTGSADGAGRAVGVVVAKFNGEITSRLLGRALEELEAAGVSRESVTIVPVPGAFELPLAAMALAKTRVRLRRRAGLRGARGDPTSTSSPARPPAGLQLAAIETGVPVAFGVLTTETIEQAEARIDRVGDVVRGALEMATSSSS